MCKNPVDPAFGEDEADLQAREAPFVAGEGDPELSMVASSASSKRSVKKTSVKKPSVKKTEKNTRKRKDMQNEPCTTTEGCGSVLSPMHIRVVNGEPPDSPAQNTRSKKRLHM